MGWEDDPARWASKTCKVDLIVCPFCETHLGRRADFGLPGAPVPLEIHCPPKAAVGRGHLARWSDLGGGSQEIAVPSA
jgi:hypothetical protein